MSVRHSLHRWLGRTATLSARLRTSGVGGDDYAFRPGIAGFAGGGDDEAYWGVIDASGRIGVGDTFSASVVSDDAWHHVAFTRDHLTGAVQVFVDGSVSATGIEASGELTRRFHSIGRVDGINNYFEGSLADVRVFNHVLDPDEIEALAVP